MNLNIWFRHIYNLKILETLKDYPFVKNITCTLDPTSFSFIPLALLKEVLSYASSIGISVGIELGNQKEEIAIELIKKIKDTNQPFFLVANLNLINLYSTVNNDYYLEIEDDIPFIQDTHLKGLITQVSLDYQPSDQQLLQLGLDLENKEIEFFKNYDFYTLKMNNFFETSYRNPDYQKISNYLQEIRSNYENNFNK